MDIPEKQCSRQNTQSFPAQFFPLLFLLSIRSLTHLILFNALDPPKVSVERQLDNQLIIFLNLTQNNQV